MNVNLVDTDILLTNDSVTDHWYMYVYVVDLKEA